jgi:glycosyltransferase involved in cell wall biosynthesis
LDISVVISTFGRATKLAQCLRSLAAQTMDQVRFEVLVGFDGPDEQAARMAEDVWSDERPQSLRLVPCPRGGANITRNRLLELARGRYAVFLNDDVIADRQLLELHLREQEQWGGEAGGVVGAGAMIVGTAPWRIFEDDTLFDRAVRESSMVFFYEQMLEMGDGGERARHGPRHDWGYRHFWTLNASAPLEPVRSVGGFLAAPLGYGHDDIELAWRLRERFGMPVYFRPEARVVHDHRYQPGEVLQREFRLGRASWHYAALNPPFARELFGRDVRSEEELAYSREFVARERSAAERIEASFVQLPRIPASAIEGPHAAALVRIVYQQHLLLKRWYWRRGLLDAAHEEAGGGS